VTKSSFGTTQDGKAVDLYTLTSGKAEVRLISFGARVQSIKVPDRTGAMGDVALGFNTIAEYEADKSTYVGSIVGRYGNRLAGGKFSLDGKSYQVPLNNGPNSLHGGTVGFDRAVWEARQVADGVEFTHVSPDGDQGFPGTLTAHVTYTLKGDALHIDYAVSADKATVINLTNHSYFNLAGDGSGEVLGDVLTIPADRYTPVDFGLIPTGIEPVAGTPFDFRRPTAIGARIDSANEQLKLANGYDHNWVLNGPAGTLKEAAKVYDPATGRVLTVSTTEPGVQFYTGNFLDGTLKGKSGAAYAKHLGFCLETQHFPDSPNHPAFPTTELKPGRTYKSTTVFAFTVQK
jgi:aldose 1-epimerase